MGFLANKFKFPCFFCRTAYCPNCAKEGRPKKHDSFLILGSSKKEYWKLSCQRLIPPQDFGFTPHLFLYQQEFETERSSFIVFRKTCLMDGCGITFFETSEGKKDYFFNKGDVSQWDMATMPHRSGLELYMSFSDSGYELDWDYLKHHKGAVISPNLNYIDLRRLYSEKEKSNAVFISR